VVIVPLYANLVTTLFELALGVTAVFLILLVLVQRGRGGGLAGALGGMGGSSAFGAKAGDVFTRITIGVAAFWIILCIVAAKYSAPTSNRLDIDETGSATTEITNLKSDSEQADAATEPVSDAASSSGTAAGDAADSSGESTGGEQPSTDSEPAKAE
jgi:preprotein translocase subunit SecG